MKLYLVGGKVRDDLLGLPSKDHDFTVVLDEALGGWDPFQFMVERLRVMGFEIFLTTPQYLTVRARFPKGHPNAGVTADFVLARKESGYSDGRRPDSVEPGSLMDDLKRRDFTMNAIAQDENGELIDPFGGVQDIQRRIIRPVGSAYKRLTEDPLRALRALRLSLTKTMAVDVQIEHILEHPDVLRGIGNLSNERVYDELSKMFRYDTLTTLWLLAGYPELEITVFQKVNLEPTLKTKGRG